jgi:hypothetical protein
LLVTYLALRQNAGAIMQETIAVISATGALAFGGVGIANATVGAAPTATPGLV